MSALSLKCYIDFCRILKERSGIDLGEQKQSLVESRLARRLSLVKSKDFNEYLSLIKQNESEMTFFIEALTTNKTDWYREEDHFQFLSSQIAKTKNAGLKSPCMIWSAASSTGEEAYTIAMTCEETTGLNRNYRILGTDINLQVIDKAQQGIYSTEYLKSQIPAQKIKSWFRPTQDPQKMQICPEIRQMVKFRHFNLLESQLPAEIKFDFIFLRNVLIYFDNPTIEKVIRRLVKYLNPGGFLLIGHSETLNGIPHPLKHVGQSIYRYE